MKKSLAVSSLAVLAFGTSLASCGSASDAIRIGMECDYAPFNWSQNSETEFTLPIANAAAKYADGYDVQIAKRIGEATGRRVEIVAVSWTSLIPDLNAGDLDLVVAGMTDNEERRRSIAFTDEYYRSELVLITAKDIAERYANALSEEEFGALVNGQNIVSQKGTMTYDIIGDVFSSYGAIRDAAVPTFALAAEDVKNGSSFAMTAELPVAQSIVANYLTLGIVRIDQAILGEAQAELGVSVGLRKNDTALLKQVNDILAGIGAEERVSIMQAAVERSGN